MRDHFGWLKDPLVHGALAIGALVALLASTVPAGESSRVHCPPGCRSCAQAGSAAEVDAFLISTGAMDPAPDR